MWCTRWFLPLLLLPVPTAPPYFLILFLVSLTMHARPCIYCIMLLSSLFASSCYWQPMLTSDLLARHPTLAPPPALNISLPELTPLPERCWCDLYDSVFSAFNVTRWEQRALYRVVRPAVDEWKKAHEDAKAQESAAAAAETTEAQREREPEHPPLPPCSAEQERHWLLRGHGPLTRFLVERIAGQPDCRPSPSGTETAPAPVSDGQGQKRNKLAAPAQPQQSTAPTTENEKADADAAPEAPLPWIRRRYDLTPYGVGLILDFGLGTDDS